MYRRNSKAKRQKCQAHQRRYCEECLSPLESEISEQHFRLYKIFVILAVLGMLSESDDLMMEKGDIIRQVARYFRSQFPPPPKQLYRGMLVQPRDVPPDQIAKPQGVQFVSFTEDLQVACWFAAQDTVFASVLLSQKPGATGWVGEYIPEEDEILFHYSWIDTLRQGYGTDIYELAVSIGPSIGLEDAAIQVRHHIMNQKEVICEANVVYPIKPVENFDCKSTRDLDNKFIPRPDFILAPPGLAQMGITAGTRINIDHVVHHMPHRRCYQCQQSAVRTTYILEGGQLVVDLCVNCAYVFRNPIRGQ